MRLSVQSLLETHVKERRIQKETALFQSIPSEIWHKIFLFVGSPKVLTSRLVCKQWNSIISCNIFWKHLYFCVWFKDSTVSRFANIDWFHAFWEKKKKEYKVASWFEESKVILCSASNKSKEELQKKCKWCANFFDEMRNTDRSCRHHTHAYNQYIKEWNCCINTNPEHPGCTFSKHEKLIL